VTMDPNASGPSGLILYLGTFSIRGLVKFESLNIKANWEPGAPLPSEFSPVGHFRPIVRDINLHIDNHQSITEVSHLRPLVDVVGIGAFKYRFTISALGTGYVLHESLGPFDSKLQDALTKDVANLVTKMSSWVPEAFPGIFREDRPETLLEPGRVLWWHKIFNRDTDILTENDFWGSVTIHGPGENSITVGDGFTTVSDPMLKNHESRNQIVKGLMASTDDWIIADSTNRLLQDYLNEVSVALESGRVENLKIVNSIGEELVEQGQHLRLYLDLRDRYMVVLRGVIWKAARKAWGLEGELSEINTKISLAHNQALTAANRAQSSRDSIRNGALFAIAILAAIQGMLGLVDFAVHPSLTVEHPTRVFLSASILTISLGVGLTIFTNWMRHKLSTKRQAKVLKNSPSKH